MRNLKEKKYCVKNKRKKKKNIFKRNTLKIVLKRKRLMMNETLMDISIVVQSDCSNNPYQGEDSK